MGIEQAYTHGDEVMECQDMIPGHYYCSDDLHRYIVLPLDTEGNVVVFFNSMGYYDIYGKTTCEKYGIYRVTEMKGCHMFWRKVWNSDDSYILTAAPLDSELPKRREVLLGWEDVLTAVTRSRRRLCLKGMCLLSLQDGCIHLEWLDYLYGGLVSELGKAGYLKGWYTPGESRYYPFLCDF